MSNPFNYEEMKMIRHGLKVSARYLVNKEEQSKFWALRDKVKKMLDTWYATKYRKQTKELIKDLGYDVG